MLTRKTINVRINDFNLIEILLYFNNHILNSNDEIIEDSKFQITQFYSASYIKLTFVYNLTNEKNH